MEMSTVWKIIDQKYTRTNLASFVLESFLWTNSSSPIQETIDGWLFSN